MKFIHALSIVALTAAGSAQAQEVTITGRGENFAMSYAPSYTGNIVGGGMVRLLGNGESLQVQYQDSRFAHRTTRIPAFQGGSEGEIIYLTPPYADTVASR